MPERLVIVSTSPLVYLHRAGYLDLLAGLYGKIIAPPAVQEEVLEGRRLGADVPDLSALAWIEVRSLGSSALLPAIADLGPGEAEVIGLARESPGSLVVMDDQLGRRIAEICGLTVTGTAGVLLKAKQEGYVPAVAPVLHALQQPGFWLSEEIIRLVLAKAGEEIKAGGLTATRFGLTDFTELHPRVDCVKKRNLYQLFRLVRVFGWRNIYRFSTGWPSCLRSARMRSAFGDFGSICK